MFDLHGIQPYRRVLPDYFRFIFFSGTVWKESRTKEKGIRDTSEVIFCVYFIIKLATDLETYTHIYVQQRTNISFTQ